MNVSVTLVGFGTIGGRIGGRSSDSNKHGDLSENNSAVSCFYCKESRHNKKLCPKLIEKNTTTILSIYICYNK